MSAETLFLSRVGQPGFQELDDVVLLSPATTVAGDKVAAGLEGTVVAVLAPGRAYVVEFPEPEGTLVCVPASKLARARHTAP